MSIVPAPLPDPLLDSALRYRPLRGGVRIENPGAQEVGTIGFIAKDGNARFIVSCGHVLQGCDVGATPGIFQPTVDAANLIASAPVRSGALDCAAVEIVAGIECLAECLNFGGLGGATLLVPGMIVRKCGATTSCTEGEIRRVGGEFLVAPLATAAATDLLTDTGDSGALWVESATNQPVALCRGGRMVGGKTWAVIIPIVDVLNELQVEVLA